MKRKRRFLGYLFCMVLILGCGKPVWAKGIFGVTDLINAPNNRVLSPGGFNLGAHFNEHSKGKIQIDVGLVTDLELGVALDLTRDYNDLAMRFKYRLIPETKDTFGFAFGIQDIGKDVFSPYVVMGHVLSPYDLRWSLGLGGGGLGGLFFGISKVYNTSQVPRVILIGECDSYGLNLGVKIQMNKGLMLDVGVIDMDNFVIGFTLTN
jgi:hypothetical protein